MEITKRQKAILEAIEWLTFVNGYPPTVRELGEAVGLKSTSTTHGHLQRMKARGWVAFDPVKPRTLVRCRDVI